MKICKVVNCDKPVRAKEMCIKHYTRLRRGQPLEDRVPKIWSQMDIVWIAGIIEGEGCIHVNKTKDGCYPRIIVKMTDEDIIERLFKLTEIGSVGGPYHSNSYEEHWKPQWKWSIGKKKEVCRLLLAIYPLLGKKKQQEVKEIVDNWSASLVD